MTCEITVAGALEKLYSAQGRRSLIINQLAESNADMEDSELMALCHKLHDINNEIKSAIELCKKLADEEESK